MTARVTGMSTLQVWLPTLDPALSKDSSWRDLRRAEREWKGETTIWLSPEFDTPVRWITPRMPWSSELAIHGEETERIDVLHVGDDGFIFGKSPSERFGAPRIGGLLRQWLAVGMAPKSLVSISPAPQTIVWQRPRLPSMPTPTPIDRRMNRSYARSHLSSEAGRRRVCLSASCQ